MTGGRWGYGVGRIGGDPMQMKPAEFDAFVQKEIDINATLVKASGVQIN